jgi:hypothetical protein
MQLCSLKFSSMNLSSIFKIASFFYMRQNADIHQLSYNRWQSRHCLHTHADPVLWFMQSPSGPSWLQSISLASFTCHSSHESHASEDWPSMINTTNSSSFDQNFPLEITTSEAVITFLSWTSSVRYTHRCCDQFINRCQQFHVILIILIENA